MKGGDHLKDRRPYLSSECKNIPEAEKWRRQIIGEMSRKVAEIQNGKLMFYIQFEHKARSMDTSKIILTLQLDLANPEFVTSTMR